MASNDKKRRPPATTVEARENQLIAMTYDLVEQRLIDGTASSQETSHFLKMGSNRERLERERLRKENILLEAKAAAMESAQRVEELYGDAINAMRQYAGQGPPEEDDDPDVY